MSNKSSNNSTMSGNKFWKSNLKAVPGRPSCRKEDKIGKQQIDSSVTRFQDFQKKVSDAWDINELLYISDVDIINNDYISEPIKPSTKLNNDVKNKSVRFKKALVPILKHKIKNSNLPTVSTQSQCNLNNEVLNRRLAKFQMILAAPMINLVELQKLSWSGIPHSVRATAWRLLTGYMPVCAERQYQVLRRKRCEYWSQIEKYYDPRQWDTSQRITFHQIHIDIPRMSQLLSLFRQRIVHEIFERILFTWATRHPACGYVQGMNDLVTPFFVVFLKESSSEKLVNMDLLPAETRNVIEADTFWCFSKFLECVQDNYTFAQLGIQHRVNRIKELIHRIDPVLYQHLKCNDIDYISFSYRWMNNLLTRELSLKCTIRLWDTYLSEVDSFASFHDYICVAFLDHWRKLLLKEKDFQGLMLTLQKLPTRNWTETDIGVLVAEAYKLRYFFADAPKHLLNSNALA